MTSVLHIISAEPFICSTIVAITSLFQLCTWKVRQFPLEFSTIHMLLIGSISYYLNFFTQLNAFMIICKTIYASLMLTLFSSIMQHMDTHFPMLSKIWKPVVWATSQTGIWAFLALEMLNPVYGLYLASDLIVLVPMCITVVMVALHHLVWCKIYHINNGYRKIAIEPFTLGAVVGLAGYAFRYLTYMTCALSVCYWREAVWYATSLYMFVCFMAFSCAGNADMNYKDIKIRMIWKMLPVITENE